MQMYMFFCEILMMFTKQTSPERRLVNVLCMRDLLYFHSHNIIGLAVTDNHQMTIYESF